MTEVDAAELLATALRHLDDDDTRRPIAEIPTLDASTTRPFRPFPALAIAMASHVLTAWELRGFRVERGDHGDRMRWFTAVGTEALRPFRACTLFVPDLGTQRVIEMCGHAFCPNIAPAGPGSRCWDHLRDPSPEDPMLWLRLAAEATSPAQRAHTDPEGLALAATRLGLPLDEVCRATRLLEWTVQDLADEPAPPPSDVEDSDNPDDWPLVLTPDRDLFASDTRRTYVFENLRYSPVVLPPETLLAREGAPYTFFHVRPGGPLVVAGEDGRRFTLEWWQVQDHLPQHRLARQADEHRRRMYESPPSYDDF
ncbi:hypothetical protein [Spirillospora sp. CA-294931]|uniref:hypothetical protein n=1 Tax=Spirillospora sp. CA-294931 TaxID=3240042 RepID=UPI003D8AA3D5